MYKSIRYHVRNLHAGASITVPATEMPVYVLRNYASSASADFPGRKYSVHFNRETRATTVTRTA